MKYLIGFIAFQAGWFSCVVGAARLNAWLGPLVVSACVLVFIIVTPERARSFMVLLGLVVFGTLVESLLMQLGWSEFDTPAVVSGLCPLWMIALWANMILMVGVMAGWFRRRLFLAAIIGAISGPLAYRGGEALGALRLSKEGMAALAATWALAVPALVLVHDAFREKRLRNGA